MDVPQSVENLQNIIYASMGSTGSPEVFRLLIEVASRCSVRGLLIRGNGQGHDCESLARLTRIKVGVFKEAIPRLLKIGWIELVSTDAISSMPATLPATRTTKMSPMP